MRSGTLLTLLVTACVVTLIATPAAATSCEPITDRERHVTADAVVDGVFQPGDGGPDGTLYSPATMRVHRWHKGPGGETVRVATNTARGPDGTFSGTAGLLDPKAGEAWRLYARIGSDGVLDVTCLGAFRLATFDEPLPFTGPGPLLTFGLGSVTAGVAGLRWARRRRY